jgi:hypothetical protein
LAEVCLAEAVDVSIPDRDFSGLRVDVQVAEIYCDEFQSLIGILVD